MPALRFRIRHADGKVQDLHAETSSVLIGSGSHCEIRLPIGAARAEHVLIRSTPTGFRAVARALDPMPKIDGIDFTEAPIRSECVLAIGSTRIEVAPLDGAGTDGVARPRGKRNPRIYVYLGLGGACALALYAARPRAKTSTPEPHEVPALWSAAGMPPCPAREADEALAVAEARLELALAKQERSPFHPEDGVTGVASYEAAEACFRVAGRAAEAEDAATSAARLRQETTDRFRGHRLRLQRALATEQWALAEHESSVLLSFLPPAPSEYAAWLSNLRRRLELQYGSKGKKET